MGSGAFLVETCRQLGDELVKAWHVHNCVPKLPPDEDEVLHARRLIAQRCLYGVDKNPMAVDLAKLSLWLATLAKDHPFTFLDHSLRCGDSLVGLSREQIAAFHWQPPAKRAKDDVWFGDPIAERMRTVTEYRQRILAARDDKPYEQLRQELDVADEALSLARLAGDCVIAAYFSAGKDRERVAKLDTLARQLVKYLGPQGRIEDRQPLTEAVASLHSGDHPIQPFHWQIEFPEVFTVDAKGNRPAASMPSWAIRRSAGSNTLINGIAKVSRLAASDSRGIARQRRSVAHFFRRAFNLLRDRVLRPDRDEHDRLRATREHWSAMDLHTRRHDLSPREAAQVAGPGGSRGQRRPRVAKRDYRLQSLLDGARCRSSLPSVPRGRARESGSA